MSLRKGHVVVVKLGWVIPLRKEEKDKDKDRKFGALSSARKCGTIVQLGCGFKITKFSFHINICIHCVMYVCNLMQCNVM